VLLEMFPPADNYDRTPRMGFLEQLDDKLEAYALRVLCTYCSKQTTGHYFHCNVCELIDFDICPECLDKGFHCYVDDHYLWEQSCQDKIGEGHDEQRYYSSPKINGTRHSLTFFREEL
jgi:hypothetical protein